MLTAEEEPDVVNPDVAAEGAVRLPTMLEGNEISKRVIEIANILTNGMNRRWPVDQNGQVGWNTPELLELIQDQTDRELSWQDEEGSDEQVPLAAMSEYTRLTTRELDRLINHLTKLRESGGAEATQPLEASENTSCPTRADDERAHWDSQERKEGRAEASGDYHTRWQAPSTKQSSDETNIYRTGATTRRPEGAEAVILMGSSEAHPSYD